MHARRIAVLTALLAWPGCASNTDPDVDPKTAADVRAFLDSYTARYLELSKESTEAEWALNTRIVEGDDTNQKRVEAANGALAAFTGSVENIEKARGFLKERDRLPPLEVRQLDVILYKAANNPQTVPELVQERIRAEAVQTEKLYGFDFQIDGQSVTTNRIDEILETSTDEKERLAAWNASKEVGRDLKDGLSNLVRLRNGTVRALGYRDFFEYQVSEYGMSTEELLEMTDRFVRELRPLYREIHTWARHELAKRYGEEVPDLLPAHWLPNRWGQDWAALVSVEGFDLDSVLAKKSAEWLLRQAERFYVSLGFEPLPPSFWKRSSLYPLPAGTPYKKNNHASAWHMDLQRDVRSLMSVEPNTRWYETTHHELGHIYYYLAYSTPRVPPLLREGANRAFHEAIGSLLGFASMQKAFIEGLGLLPDGTETDPIQTLLKEALGSVVFIPWSAGVMTRFEHDLYAAGLQPDEYQKRWWDLVARYQGIVPPEPRGEPYCDAATKTHINNDAAQYYDYALSYVLLHQLHDHIAREILHQDPRNTNYFGEKEVGRFLRGILDLGARRDWREVMREHLGSDISAAAMLRYFEPLRKHLETVNRGRRATLPDA